MISLISSRKVQRAVLGIEIFLAIIMIIYIVAIDWSTLPPISMFTIAIDCTFMVINVIFFFGIIGSNEDFNYNFALICIADFMALLGECLSWACENNPNAVALEWVGDTLLFLGGLILTTAFYYLICNLVGEPHSTRNIWRIIVNILTACGMIMIIINLFTGIIFWVDEACVYTRGPIYYGYFAIPYIIWLMATIKTIKTKIKKTLKIYFLCLLLLPLVANIAALVFLGVGLTYSITMISISIVYVYYYRNLQAENAHLSKSFGRFLSDDIINTIAGCKDGKLIEGKRQRASILISDIRDYTRISENMQADDLMKMMNHYFSIMMEILVKCDGVTIEFMGDGLKAVFGAPNRRTDHAEQALKCAAMMQNAMEEINNWNKTQGYPAFEIGIGINTGTMILGSVGNSKRARYSAIGVEVNKCHFIEAQTVGNQVMLSEATLDEITIPIETDFIDFFEYNENGEGMNLYLLNSIGDILIKRTEEIFGELDNPILIDISVFRKKTYSDDIIKGKILALAHSEAIVQTETPLQRHSNVSVIVGDNIFVAKVFSKNLDNNRYIIHFTGGSTPKNLLSEKSNTN